MKTIVKETITSILATLLFAVILCGIYPVVVWGASQLLFPHQANGSLIEGSDRKIVGSEWLGQNFTSAKYFQPRPSAAGLGYDAASSSGSNLGPTSKKFINGTTKSTALPAKDAGGTPTAGPDVVDFDGVKLRVLGYCESNGIAYQLLQDDKPVDQKTFKTDKGEYDQVKLITAFNDDAKPLTIKPESLIPGDAVTASGSGLDPHISPKNALLQAARVAKERSLGVDVVKAEIAKATAGPSLGILGEAGVNVLTLNLALDKLAAH
jgi:potassium-transporting ATPase KdpC subunit